MFRILLSLGIALGVVFPAHAAPLRVVTTLPSFKSIAEAIGGERVAVTSVAAPQFNAHFIEPKPSDVLRVKRADLFVHAGLDLEVWRGPLLDAAGNLKVREGGEHALDLSRGIALLNIPQGHVTRAQGDIHLFGNPHYWSNPENGLIMARALERKLIELDPEGKEYYEARGAEFLSRLSKSIEEFRLLAQNVRGKGAVAYHDEWPYLASFLGLRMIGFLEPKPGIPPSPRQIELLTNKMKADGVRVIIQATYSPDDSSKVLAERTGGVVVKLCQNVGELPECGDYISKIEFNVRAIVQAFAGAVG